MKRFIGIKSFSKDRSGIFFGRKQDIDCIKVKMSQTNVLVIHSRSGMGKTSLINAAIIPEFKKTKNTTNGTTYINLVEVFNCKELSNNCDTFLNWENAEKDPMKFIDKNLEYFKKRYPILTNSNNNTTDSLPKNNCITLNYYLILDQTESLFNNKEHVDKIIDKLTFFSNITFQDKLKSLFNLPFEQIDVSFKFLFSITTENFHKLDAFKYVFPNILKSNYELNYIPKNEIKEIIKKTINLESEDYSSPIFNIEETYLNKLIIELSNDKGNIELFHLQLIGEELESKAIEKKNNEEKIIVLNAQDNIHSISNLLKAFYEDRIKKMDEIEEFIKKNYFKTGKISDNVFNYIENKLIKENGQASYRDINNNVEKYPIDFPGILKYLEDHRIIREYILNGHRLISLYHDNLAKPIFEHKQERLSSKKDILDILGQKSDFTSYINSLFSLREKTMDNDKLQFFTDIEISKKFYINILRKSNCFYLQSFDNNKITCLRRSKFSNKFAFANDEHIYIKDNFEENKIKYDIPRKGNYYIIDMCFNREENKLYVTDNRGEVGFYNLNKVDYSYHSICTLDKLNPSKDFHAFSIDINFDESVLAVGSNHNSPKFFDLKSGEFKLMNDPNEENDEEKDEIFIVRFFENDKLLVGTKFGNIFAYRNENKQKLWHKDYHSHGHIIKHGDRKEVKAIELSENLKKCVIGFSSGEIELFDFSTQNLHKVSCITIEGDNSIANHLSLSFSYDGNYIAIGDNFGNIHIWKPNYAQSKRNIIKCFSSGSQLFCNVEFCYKSNNQLISTSLNGKIALWDIFKFPDYLFENPVNDIGRTVCFVYKKGEINVLFSSYFGEEELRLKGKEGLGVIFCNSKGAITNKLQNHVATVYDTDICNKTGQLVTISHDNHIRVFNEQLEITHDIDIIHQIPGDFYNKVSIHPDGKQIIASVLNKCIYKHEYGKGYIRFTIEDSNLIINDLTTQKKIEWNNENGYKSTKVIIETLMLETYYSEFYYAGFDKAGDIFGISENKDDYQNIYYFNEKKQIENKHAGRINEIKFSSDNKYCISCSKDCSVNIINLEENKVVIQKVMHREGVNDCAITKYRNGYLCLTASYDHHSFLFYYNSSLGSNTPLIEVMDFYLGGDVNAVSFSDDGNMMAFAVSNKEDASFIVLPTPKGIIEWLRDNQLNNQQKLKPINQEVLQLSS